MLGADAISDKKPIIIDVGIHKKSDDSLCGDVDFSQVEPLASAIKANSLQQCLTFKVLVTGGVKAVSDDVMRTGPQFQRRKCVIEL